MADGSEPGPLPKIAITPLLRRLWPSPGDSNVQPDEIAAAIKLIFTDQLSPVQTGALLTCLHFTGWDRRADVIAKCAEAMREAASPIDVTALGEAVNLNVKGRAEGDYHGGLVSIISCVHETQFTNKRSVTLLELEVILITHSTFPPRRPSSLPRYL